MTETQPLMNYEIRAIYRRLILTMSNAAAQRLLINGLDEMEPVDPERLKLIIKGD
jgi:hypothetical protein